MLTLVCFRGVCAEDDISGSANLTYLSTETKSGEEETNTWGFTQTYNLRVNKEFTPKVNLSANLGINVNETNDTKTTQLTPDIRLNLKNEYFDADTGYRITEKGLDILTMVSDEDRFTTESWNANLSTKSTKYPKMRLRYNEDRNYDHLATHETDTKTTNFSGSLDHTYRFLNFNYNYKNNISDDYVTGSITETDTNEGRVDFRKSFWANKITTSGSYSITNKKTENKTGWEEEVQPTEKKKAYDGLYVQDTTPASSTLKSKPALIDGVKTTSTGINIGGGVDNLDQNIGLELTSATGIDTIYLYTTTPDASVNINDYTGEVYLSDNNLSWNLIPGASFNYNEIEQRVEISFNKTSAKYFKVVNTENDNDKNLFVTEIEAHSTYEAYDGLYAKDPTPLSAKLVSTPALINGSANINIGGGDINLYQNIGLDMSSPIEINKIYVYTTTPDGSSNFSDFAVEVYSSDDNDSWKLIPGASFKYNVLKQRAEISFTKTSAQYFKVVNTANDNFNLYVTKIEASSVQDAFTATETDQTTQTTQANVRYKPTDWLSFTYDFTQDEQEKDETDADSTKTRQSNHNISGLIGKEFKVHKYLKIRPEYRRRNEYKYDSETEVKDKTTDTYRLHFLSSPLKALDTDLSLNHTVSKEDSETQSKISSALLQISAKLREGADLDVDTNITRSENPVSESETTTKYINSNLRLELTRMLTAEIEYNNNWTETENPDSSSTGRTHDAKCTLYWRPSHDFYLRGSYGVDRDHTSGDETTEQQYNMNWLMTDKVQINMGYTLNRNDSISSTYSSDLSWNLSRMFTLRFNYNWSRQQADIITETQTFTTNLSARF